MNKNLFIPGAACALAFTLAAQSAQAEIDSGIKSFGLYEDYLLVGEGTTLPTRRPKLLK